MRAVLFLISAFLSFYTFAQSTSPKEADLQQLSFDSIESVFHQTKRHDPRLAKSYARAWLKKAILEQHKKERYLAEHHNANIFSRLSERDSALYYIDEAITHAEAAKDSIAFINSLYLKGKIHSDFGAYDIAIEYYTKVNTIFKLNKKKSSSARLTHDIAMVKNQIGNYEGALILLKENLSYYKNVPKDKLDKIGYINTLITTGAAYTNLAEEFPEQRIAYLDSAKVHNDVGLQISKVYNDIEGYCIFLTTAAIIHLGKQEFDKALQGFTEAEQEITTNNFTNQLPILHLYKGKLFFLTDDIDNAITHLKKANALSEEIKIQSIHLQEMYILLSKCYEQKGNLSEAIHYANLFREKDKANDRLAQNASDKLYKKYDIAAYKIKIDELTSESKEQSKKYVLFLCISALLIIILLSSFIFYRKKQLQNKKNFDALLLKMDALEKEKKATPSVKKSSLKITDENVMKILKGLEKFEQKKMYLHKNCTVHYVAKKIDTNNTYLSKVLQMHKKKKFIPYITDLRIEYAITELKNNTQFRSYDIKSIAAELGFNTAESFAKAFKRKTGIYPSFFIKNLNKIEP